MLGRVKISACRPVCVATQYSSARCKLTTSSYLFTRWHLFRHVGYLRHQQQVFLTLKVVSKSRVTWATSVPILVFLDLSVLELGPMYATDRRQTKASLNASALLRRRHNNHSERRTQATDTDARCRPAKLLATDISAITNTTSSSCCSSSSIQHASRIPSDVNGSSIS